MEISEDLVDPNSLNGSHSIQNIPSSLPEVRNSSDLKETTRQKSSSFSNKSLDNATLPPTLLLHDSSFLPINSILPSQLSSSLSSLPPTGSILPPTSILYPPTPPQPIPPGTTLSRAPPYVHVKIVSVKKDLSEGRESLSFEICTKVN